MAFSLCWFVFTVWLALPWMRDLAELANWPVALVIVGGIALVPGLMNAFLAASLLLDRRPPRRSFARYPSISVLIAAYNEEQSIRETLHSVALQNYPGPLEVWSSTMPRPIARHRLSRRWQGRSARWGWSESRDARG
jgi:biofilm PGA synthesis N-glycosyltransferase PgaC